MTRQYLRQCQLLLGSDGGEGLDVSELRVQFSIVKGSIQTVNVADITIFNPSMDTVHRVRDEFTRVVLTAGYPGNAGVIFDGNIRWKRYGRESQTDTYLHLQAAEGDEGMNFGVVSHTLNAGYTKEDEYEAALISMRDYGITGGPKPTYSQQKSARGKVLFGSVKEWMREHSKSTYATVSVQGTQLQVVSMLAYLPGEAVVLTSETGLIGFPQLTFNGVQARCLLNPAITINGRVQIDQKSIQDIALSQGFLASARQAGDRSILTPAADGFYKVVAIQHIGDTRGNEWYTDIVCVNLDGTMTPITQASIFMGVTPP